MCSIARPVPSPSVAPITRTLLALLVVALSAGCGDDSTTSATDARQELDAAIRATRSHHLLHIEQHLEGSEAAALAICDVVAPDRMSCEDSEGRRTIQIGNDSYLEQPDLPGQFDKVTGPNARKFIYLPLDSIAEGEVEATRGGFRVTSRGHFTAEVTVEKSEVVSVTMTGPDFGRSGDVPTWDFSPGKLTKIEAPDPGDVRPFEEHDSTGSEPT